MPNPGARKILTLDGLAMLLEQTARPESAERFGFTHRLLETIAAANAGELARLRAVFPRQVTAYHVWITASAPPSADDLLARTRLELERDEARAAADGAVVFEGGVLFRKDTQ